jgi:hypothetical protein
VFDDVEDLQELYQMKRINVAEVRIQLQHLVYYTDNEMKICELNTNNAVQITEYICKELQDPCNTNA